MHTFYTIAIYESENVDYQRQPWRFPITLCSHEWSAIRNPSSWVEKSHKFIND